LVECTRRVKKIGEKPLSIKYSNDFTPVLCFRRGSFGFYVLVQAINLWAIRKTVEEAFLELNGKVIQKVSKLPNQIAPGYIVDLTIWPQARKQPSNDTTA